MSTLGGIIVFALGLATGMTGYTALKKPDRRAGRRLGMATFGLGVATLGIAIMFLFVPNI
jgi:hypothetical protein